MGTDGRTSQNSAIQAYTTVDKRFFIFQIQKFELQCVPSNTAEKRRSVFGAVNFFSDFCIFFLVDYISKFNSSLVDQRSLISFSDLI